MRVQWFRLDNLNKKCYTYTGMDHVCHIFTCRYHVFKSVTYSMDHGFTCIAYITRSNMSRVHARVHICHVFKWITSSNIMSRVQTDHVFKYYVTCLEQEPDTCYSKNSAASSRRRWGTTRMSENWGRCSVRSTKKRGARSTRMNWGEKW